MIIHTGGHIAGFVDEPIAVTAGAVLCLSGAIIMASNRLAQQYVGMVHVGVWQTELRYHLHASALVLH
jgi:hypothetical protein